MSDQAPSNHNGSGRAPYMLLQALIESSFESVKLLGLMDCGNQIAKQLGSPSDPLEALAKLELGMANIHVSQGPKGGRLVCLRGCPFAPAVSKLDPWSEHAQRMVQRFNASPRGGAAVHPICIGHLAVREAYGGINLGCRNTANGKMAISVPTLLDEAGMTEAQVRERLEGNACLYLLRS